MAVLYFDCSYGSRKDTFARAVIGLLPETEQVKVASISPGTSATKESGQYGDGHCHSHDAHNQKEDIHSHAGIHEHHSVEEVRSVIASLGLSERAERYAKGVYDLIAHAEAKAHGVSLEEVHFHEVGQLDAVVWIGKACAAIDALNPEGIAASAVCTGFGFVDCAHGTLPIPAPATANVLDGVPCYAGTVGRELTTPTGAALVVYFAHEFVENIPEDTTWVAVVGRA